jgi:hypothetical protein
MGINSITGVFPLEATLMHNISAFVIGGALFGLVSSGLLFFAGATTRFRPTIINAAVVTTAIWVLLRFSGTILAASDHHRFHFDRAATVQGFFLAIVLGIILGVLWKTRPREA